MKVPWSKKSTVTLWSTDRTAPTESDYERFRPLMRKALTEAMGNDNLEFSEFKHWSPRIIQDEAGEYHTDWSETDWAITMYARRKN